MLQSGNKGTSGSAQITSESLGTNKQGMHVASYPGGNDYETVAASQTDQVLGASGAIGDFLDKIVILVATAATATVTVKDGATTVLVFPNSPGDGIGAYTIPLGIRAVGAGFSITTGAGSSVVAVGEFT